MSGALEDSEIKVETSGPVGIYNHMCVLTVLELGLSPGLWLSAVFCVTFTWLIIMYLWSFDAGG